MNEDSSNNNFDYYWCKNTLIVKNLHNNKKICLNKSNMNQEQFSKKIGEMIQSIQSTQLADDIGRCTWNCPANSDLVNVGNSFNTWWCLFYNNCNYPEDCKCYRCKDRSSGNLVNKVCR
jgi:hypothetical protein